MKKGKKLGAIALCGIVSASALTGSPIVANNVSADQISIENFETTYAINNDGEVKIPRANLGTDMKVTPVGSNTEVVDLLDGDNYFSFKPTALQYKVTFTNGTTEKSFIVNIDYKSATLSLDESTQILPETTVKGRDVILPFATIKDSEGNNIALDYSQNAESAEHFVKVTNKSADEIVVSQSDVEYKSGIKYLKFNPTNPGTYTVTYVVRKSGYDVVSKSFTIAVKSNLETTANISFKLKDKIGTPVIGKEFTLPGVTAKDETNNIENVKVKVEVSYQVKNNKGELSDEVKINDFKFTPTQEGYYVFKYVVKDAFGNQAEVFTTQTAKVKDTQAPTNLIYTSNYVVVDGKPFETNAQNENTGTEATDKSYLIKNNMKSGDTLIVPAIFAEDNSNENLTYTRTLKKYEFGSVIADIQLDADCTKTQEVTLTEVGTYTLKYTVKDGKDNVAEREFSIYVYDSTWKDTTSPTISFSAEIDDNTKWGNKVLINKPTVSDLDNAGRVSDTNCETHAYYYYKAVDSADETNIKKTTKTEIKLGSNSKFEIQTLDNIDLLEQQLEVDNLSNWNIFLCFEYQAKDDNDKTAEATKEIKVIGATEVPTLSVTSPASIEYKQGAEVTLGTVTVSYSNDRFREYLKDINVNIEVVNTETKVRTNTFGESYTFTNNSLTVFGAKFMALSTGDYTIIVTATDVNGNTIIKEGGEFKVESTFKTEIILQKVKDGALELELGSSDESAKIFTMYKDGKVVEATDKNLKITVISGADKVAIDSNKYFKAISTGKAVVRFEMYDENDETNLLSYKELDIKVVDSKAPELIFELDNPFKSTYVKYQEIALPMPYVKDLSNINTNNVKITVKRNGNDTELKEPKYTPTENGTYTIEYKVQDESGNSAVKTFTINVGDVDGPIISIPQTQVTKEVGSIYTLDLEELEIYDEFEKDGFVMSLGVNTFITMKDAEGNEIKSTSTDGYSYKLDKAGTYTLTIEAKDGSNNTTKIEQTITVSEPEAEPVKPNTAGTVIAILASLLILAFVIFYFFKPEKSSNAVTRKREDKIEDKDKK